jgi:putative transposase
MRPVSLWKVKKMDLSFNYTAKNVHYAFGSEDRITIEGTPYRALNYNEVGWLMQLVDGSNLAQEFTHEHLSRLASLGRLRQERDHFNPHKAMQRLKTSCTQICALGEKQKARVSKRSAWVAAMQDMYREGKLKMTDESLAANAAELLMRATKLVKSLSPLGEANPEKSYNVTELPSCRTLRRWLKELNTLGEGGLIDNMHKRGNRNGLMGSEEKALLSQQVRSYGSVERPTQRIIFDQVTAAFHARNLERASQGHGPTALPSRETVRRAIKGLEPFSVMANRHGLEAARKKYAPTGQGLQLTRPGERVEIDEHTFDLITLMRSNNLFDLFTDEERRAFGLDNAKARWVLTVAICATTRCILGMVISRGAKATAAIQCLQMVTADKGQWSDAVRARGSWDMHLVPETIVTDNGTAFKSEAFRFACADLGISVEHTIAGMPEQRARNERFFGTLTKAIPPISPGRTFSDIVTKGDADPSARAALTFDDVAFALVRWIVDAYHNTPHGGLGGETPLQCWRRLTELHGVTPRPDNRRLRMVFGIPYQRTLGKEGLEVLGVLYHSEQLARRMLHKAELLVELRWHPRDLGAIEVLLDGEWFEVPAKDPRMQGQAAQTWLTAWRKTRASVPANKRVNLEIVHEAIKAIKNRNATAMAMAGLLVDEWDDEKMRKLENEMFQSAFAKPPTGFKAGANELGRAVPTAATKRTKGTANSDAKTPPKSTLGFEEN